MSRKLSLRTLARTVADHRRQLGITQAQLSSETGINRSILSRLESEDYAPSVDQLLALADALGFEPANVLEDPDARPPAAPAPLPRRKIAVAGTG